MKTSNIIAIGFITFVLAGMLTLFIATKSHEKSINKNTRNEKIILPPFSVLVGESGTNFFVQSGDSNSLTITNTEDKKVSTMPFRIKNDTLYILNNQSDNTNSIHVQCVGIHSIIAHKNSIISISHFYSDSLKLTAEKGRIFFDTEKKEKTNQQKLNINLIAKDSSNIQIFKSNISKLSIHAERSDVHLENNDISELSADIQNKSRLEFYNNELGTMNIKPDQTSGYNLSNH
jgi:hypothetical protein